MGAHRNACSQNVSFLAFPWGAASKRIGNDEDVETQGFRKVACATTAPMHFQLIELDVLLELLELLLVELSLLLVELSRADLTLSSNSCLRQGISFFHVALVECPLLLLYYVKAILITRCLRRACARLAREHGEIFRKGAASSCRCGPCAGLARCLRLGADLPNPGGAPPLNEEVKAY